jgi:apolipoprotein N-acyltransferase
MRSRYSVAIVAGLLLAAAFPRLGLAGLAWDLGALYVLFPPQPQEILPDLVSHLMPAAPSSKEP